MRKDFEVRNREGYWWLNLGKKGEVERGYEKGNGSDEVECHISKVLERVLVECLRVVLKGYQGVSAKKLIESGVESGCADNFFCREDFVRRMFVELGKWGLREEDFSQLEIVRSGWVDYYWENNLVEDSYIEFIVGKGVSVCLLLE